MRPIFGFLILALIVLLVVAVSLALVLGAALLVGWLFTKVVAFTLFEATLLGLLALIAAGAFWIRFFGTLPTFVDESGETNGRRAYANGDAPEPFKQLPVTRFYKTEAEKTWDAWLRYQMADDIYFDLQDAPSLVSRLDDRRVQELAIRLAEIGVAALKNKSPQSKELRLTKTMFKRQMTRMGQQAYDDDIMDIALAEINNNIDYFYEELQEVIRTRAWETFADMPDTFD